MGTSCEDHLGDEVEGVDAWEDGDEGIQHRQVAVDISARVARQNERVAPGHEIHDERELLS